jgi:hypothetical protein
MTAEPRNELDPNQVVLNLMNLSRAIGKLADELDGLEEAAVRKKEAYTLAYAKTFLQAGGAVEVRKQTTLMETSDERLDADLSETLVKAHKRKIDTLRVRIDVGRSAAALVRAEAELLNVRGR